MIKRSDREYYNHVDIMMKISDREYYIHVDIMIKISDREYYIHVDIMIKRSDRVFTFLTQCQNIRFYETQYRKPVSEFEPRHRSAKNRFQLSAGLNLDTMNTILSGTNNIWAATQI